MAKEVRELHLIDKWSITDPDSAQKTLKYGKNLNYEFFYTGGLRIAAREVRKDTDSGFTKFIEAMVNWNNQIFIYDSVLVDGNNCIGFPIDQSTLGESIKE